MGIFARMQLNHGRPQPNCRINLAGVRLNEQADADACICQPGDNRGQLVVEPRCIQPALCRAFGPAFGHDAGRMRLMTPGNVQHLIGSGHLQVHGKPRLAHERVEICISNMATVFAQMDGNAIAARLLNNLDRAERVRMVAAACVANGRNMINIDAKPQMAAHAASFLLPGLMAGIAWSSGGS